MLKITTALSLIRGHASYNPNIQVPAARKGPFNVHPVKPLLQLSTEDTCHGSIGNHHSAVNIFYF